MVSYAYHPGPHVDPAIQRRSRLCNAEKRHTGRYQQVCDHPESTGIRIIQLRTNILLNAAGVFVDGE